MSAAAFVPPLPLPPLPPLLRSARTAARTALRRRTAMSEAPPPPPPPQQQQQLVQYVVVRRDLLQHWPLGSVIAQGVHAAVAAVARSARSEHTARYTAEPNLSTMRTVVLQVDAEPALLRLADRLHAAHVPFAAWTEHPENVLTALASAPRPVPLLKPHFAHLRLFK